MRTYFFVFLTIFLTVYGQIIIKARAGVLAVDHVGKGFLIAMFLDPWVLSGLTAALMASATWMMAVRTAHLSAIYPYMALTFVIIPILAVFVFGESLNSMQILGISIIVLGISLSTYYA